MDVPILSYLTKFGYFFQKMTGKSSLNTEDFVTRALIKFQKFGDIPATGILDKDTVQLMTTPRCGLPDTQNVDVIENTTKAEKENTRQKRYALEGSRWSIRKLKYRVSRYPSSRRLRMKKVDMEVKKAFTMWSSVSNLTFEQVRKGKINIEIRFLHK